MSLLTDIQLPAVQLAAVSKSYPGAAGRVPVLREVSPSFPQRALTAVTGPSGSGRTTLLNCAAGLDKPDSGKVEFFSLKHRVLRYLVEHEGFRTFALQTSWSSGLRLDTYVRTGEGDPRRLMREEFQDTYAWWNTRST
ncbi:ABC-type Mn2+/Zn2+ transport system ATPase subunit [Streptomyces sp. V4I23]|nr:ABC-type Mn2+/Zn2+ transport system ATPase subunit [Streptomyces sp. V4I23]